MFSYSRRVKFPEGTHFQTRTWLFGGELCPLAWDTGMYRAIFQNGSRKVLVCDSIRPSGMDLCILDWQLHAMHEKHFFLFFFSHISLSGGATCSVSVWNGGLNQLWVLMIYTVFLIKKKCKKSSVASAASSVVLHGLPKADHCQQRT